MKKRWLLGGLVALLFAATRWPGMMPANFSATYALIFCCAVYFPARFAGPALLLTLLASDMAINVFYYEIGPVGSWMATLYLSYVLIFWLGQKFSVNSTWLRLVGGGMAGAIIFYVVTNTAAWLELPGYEKTIRGWVQALTTGLPGYPPTWTFFGKSLLSGGLFTGLFAGAMKLGESTEKETKESDEGVSEETQAEA